MKFKDLMIGFFIGIISAFLGMVLFLMIFTQYDPITDLIHLKMLGLLGKIITLGAILNLIVFYILLQKKKEIMARGIILSMIVLTLLTLLL